MKIPESVKAAARLLEESGLGRWFLDIPPWGIEQRDAGFCVWVEGRVEGTAHEATTLAEAIEKAEAAA